MAITNIRPKKFVTKCITRDEKGCFKIVIKWSIHQEVVIIINIFASNMLKHVKQKLIKLKGEIHYSIIIVGDFNIPTPKPQTVFSIMVRTWRKINKEKENQQGNRFKQHCMKIGLN